MKTTKFGRLIIDTADILASADGEESRWAAINRVSRMIGANAVSAGTFDWNTKEPDYVRTSMDPLFLARYADCNFHEIDPVMADIRAGLPQRFYDFTKCSTDDAPPSQRIMLEEVETFGCNFMLATTWRDGDTGKTVAMDWSSDPRILVEQDTARAFTAVASMLAVALCQPGEESHDGWAFTNTWQKLSPTERDVLSHLASGLPVYLIGGLLKLTEFEVWRLLHTASRKMKAQSTEQTLALAIARQQITP